MATMLRSTTVAEIAALKERCTELRSQSMKPEAVDATQDSVEIALKQKQAQYELELDRIRRSIVKSATARSIKSLLGDRVATEQAIIEQDGSPTYRDRTRCRISSQFSHISLVLSLTFLSHFSHVCHRSKRGRVVTDLKAMLKTSSIQVRSQAFWSLLATSILLTAACENRQTRGS
jgi:hypothetical protein